MSRSKVFVSSQPASQPTEQSALLSYLFETSFKNALKRISSHLKEVNGLFEITTNKFTQIWWCQTSCTWNNHASLSSHFLEKLLLWKQFTQLVLIEWLVFPPQHFDFIFEQHWNCWNIFVNFLSSILNIIWIVSSSWRHALSQLGNDSILEFRCLVLALEFSFIKITSVQVGSNWRKIGCFRERYSRIFIFHRWLFHAWYFLTNCLFHWEGTSLLYPRCWNNFWRW